MLEKYILTIIMPSYNKAQYIREALDSIFMQKTSYLYQIIVADDGSTDGTVEIVQEYQQKHANIELLPSEKNQGLYKNVIRAYAMTKTDYFCVLDPDDFWIDEYKIQKSLDFLEHHKDYTIYVTNTLYQYPDGKRTQFINNSARDSVFEDYFKFNAALGCTLGSMFRNVVFQHGLPEKMMHLPSDTCSVSFRGDSFRSIIHLKEGKAHAVKDFDAVYRITKEGLWQGSSRFEQDIMNALFFIDMYKYFDEQYVGFLALGCKTLARIRTSKEYLNETENQKYLPMYLKAEQYLHQNEDIIEKYIFKNASTKCKLGYFVYKKLKNKLSYKGLL